MNKYKSAVVLFIAFLVLGGFVIFSNAEKAPAQNRPVYWGLTGNDVSRLQQTLYDWGYYPGPVDGVFGNTTYRSLISFQANNGLASDGVAGPATWAALGFSSGSDPDSQPAPAEVSRGVSNRDETHLLARVIEGEAANESFAGKVAVGAVILNRLESAAFPHSLAGIVYQPGAFESVSNGQYDRPLTDDSLRAATMAMSGWDPTGGALYFWNPAKPVSPWVWTRNVVTQIGRHIFAR
ncbi:MAG TPA: spore cortex-lytic enzyme [Desulfotomaculum sp.]|nr:MAG: Spore cortex-lytic enzyme [Desulfotomaculum sp. 46_80]HAG10779.1 spore cortex-lytic enzyme [Desulfotomaculum sp.]HBY04563.1 spore cortex-lytic enzyme [Desulfotomaculum sp.]